MNKDYSTEQWKPVVDYENEYEVSSYCKIRSIVPWHGVTKRKAQIDKDGYCRLSLNKKSKQTHHYVHRLVAAAFIGPCPNGLQINHKDGVKENNYFGNLEYVTNSENAIHAHRVLGTHPIKNHGRRFNKDDLFRMRKLRSEGMNYSEIGRHLNIGEHTVRKILLGIAKWTRDW